MVKTNSLHKLFYFVFIDFERLLRVLLCVTIKPILISESAFLLAAFLLGAFLLGTIQVQTPTEYRPYPQSYTFTKSTTTYFKVLTTCLSTKHNQLKSFIILAVTHFWIFLCLLRENCPCQHNKTQKGTLVMVKFFKTLTYTGS